MSNPRRPSPISSTCIFFAPLALVLLLVGAPAANAQDNANGANSNNGNQNVNANRNANTNTGANANNANANNTNANRNSNANGSQNGNVNSNTNQSEDNANAALRAEKRRDAVVTSGWYYLLVTVLFGLLSLPFAYAIYRAIRFSKGTFGPLGLPDGSLRAILAYTLVVFLGFYVYASVVSFSEFKPPEFLIGIVATVIGFYFGSRTNDNSGRGAAGSLGQTGIVGGTVKDSTGTATQDATVELTQGDGKKLTAKTDKAGKFEIKNVPAGEHSIQASMSGHQPSDQTKVTVKAGETQTVNLTLK